MEKKTCEIFLVISEDGDYEVATDDGTAVERHEENCGGYARRIVKLVVKVTPPNYEAPVAEIEINDGAGRVEVVAEDQNA